MKTITIACADTEVTFKLDSLSGERQHLLTAGRWIFSFPFGPSFILINPAFHNATLTSSQKVGTSASIFAARQKCPGWAVTRISFPDDSTIDLTEWRDAQQTVRKTNQVTVGTLKPRKTNHVQLRQWKRCFGPTNKGNYIQENVNLGARLLIKFQSISISREDADTSTE